MKRKHTILLCTVTLALLGAALLYGQAAQDTSALGDQLRSRYDVVALRDGIGLVPRQASADVRLIEIRNGAVAINGNTVSAAEARQRLGPDADLVLRITYLDLAAQQELLRSGSTAVAPQPDLQQPPAGTPTRRGDLVRFGRAVTVARDEVIEGDVVVIGASADIEGEVLQEVTVVGGSLTLGPNAIVRRDVTVVGGSLNRSPTARIYGKVDEVDMGAQGSPRFGRWFGFWRPFSGVGGMVGTLLRVTLLLLGALAVVAMGRRYVDVIADRAATEPLRAGLAGLLAEVLFVPLLVVTVIVLAVSIIGIPLLLLVPFAIVLLFVIMLVGFTGVASHVGRIVARRFGIAHGPYTSVALGVLTVASITLVARAIALAGGFAFGLVLAGPLIAIGYLAEYLAWTVGIGAAILTWLSMRHHRAPAAAGAAPAIGAPPAA
jgi:hypothetical protein